MHLAPSLTGVGSRIRPAPDENGEITHPNEQCFRCYRFGHWIKTCPLRTKAFTAKKQDACPRCGREVLGTQVTYGSKGGEGKVMHFDCALEDLKDKRDRERLLALPAPEDGDEYAKKIRRCIDESDQNMLINARAGSGKTFVIEASSDRVRKRGERLVALTLNNDAAAELRRRGVEEARTFHSLGCCAWHRAHPRSTLVGAEEAEEAAEEAAAAQDGRGAEEAEAEQHHVPTKTKLLLENLYPPSDEEVQRRCKTSLEFVLFEPFVTQVVAAAKSEGVGIDGIDGSTVPDTTASWRALADRHELAKLIETKLKKGLSEARRRHATSKWPTAAARLSEGISIARKALQLVQHSAAPHTPPRLL